MAGGQTLNETQLLGDDTQVVSRSANVRVFVRLRPTAEENTIDMFEFPQHRPGMVTIKDPLSTGRSEHTYEFNAVFQPDQRQEHVFASVAWPFVDAAIQGNGGCILAYGQTGSGKTYSMFGEGSSGPDRGLLPRAIERLFEKLGEDTAAEPVSMAGDGHRVGLMASRSFAVSFLEIYLDQVRDLGRLSLEDEDANVKRYRKEGTASSHSRPLLSGGLLSDSGPLHLLSGAAPSKQQSRAPGTQRGRSGGPTDNGNACNEALEIRESPSGIVHVRGLTRLPVQDMSEVHHIISRGLSKRVTAKTAANTQSSRSHTVFTVYLPKQPDPKAPPVNHRLNVSEDAFDDITLSFVDLAGSERLAKSKAEGARFQEAVSINSSLTALGKVVLALAMDPSSGQHVPFRDSKLTRILSSSFVDGANLALLATLHPRMEDYEESLGTLSWAHRCKNVLRQQPQVTYVSQKKSAQMRVADLQNQIALLKEQIKGAESAKATQISNCGLSGLRGIGAVDDIDIAIAKAIINEENRSKGSKSSVQSDPQVFAGASAATTMAVQSTASERATARKRANTYDGAERQERQERSLREAHLAALVAVQEERGRQAEAHQQAEERMELVAKDQLRLTELEERGDVVTTELHQRGMEFQQELELVQDKLRAVLDTQGKKHHEAMQNLKESSEKQLEQADEVLLRIPNQLRKIHEITDMKRDQLERARAASKEQHGERMRNMKQDQAKQLQGLAKQWQTRLDDTEEGNARCTKELAELRDGQQVLVAQCQAELLSLYELIVKLAKLTADMEDGKHTCVWRDSLKEVVLPVGTRPMLPNAEMYPQLFDSMAREDEKVSSLERVAQRPLSSGRFRRTGAGGIAAVAAAEAIRKEADEPISEKQMAAWSATSLCKVEDDGDAKNVLAKLPVAHLRRLCVELRDQSLGLFAPGEEREALRRIALTALEDGATNLYIRDLEQRRSTEQAALSDAVERSLQLRGWLSSQKGSLAATPQQGMSRLASRSLSRPITPIGGRSYPSSRSGSRPTTATNARPPTQPVYPPLAMH